MKGLDKFGDVWDTTNWEDGQQGRFMHNSCYVTLCSSKKHEQAVIRDAKARDAAKKITTSTSQSPVHSDSLPTSLLQKRTRLSTGFIYKKDQCVWCMKKEDKKRLNRPSSKLLRIEQGFRWQDFKRHVQFLKDTDMRRRITYFVDSIPDPFAVDILYQKLRWTEHVLRNLNNRLEDCHLQNINIDSARKLFLRHVDEVIFRNREIRQLQWLLSDYKLVVGDYGLAVGDVKSGYLKQLLIKEYGERIGFKEPRQKSQSEWIYDVTGGGSYIDTALCATGISDEQLMQNLCSRLHSKINETECVQWPPRIDQLEEEEDICCALVQFMSWLKQPPKKKHLDFSPKTLCLASITTQ